MVWEESAGTNSDVFTAVFDARGNEVVAPVDVSNSPGMTDTFSGAAALQNGVYVISWQQQNNATGASDIYTAVYQFTDNGAVSDITYDGTSEITLDLERDHQCRRRCHNQQQRQFGEH